MGLPLKIKAQAERCKTLKEMAEKSRYFYVDAVQYNEECVKKNLTADIRPVLESVHHALKELTSWNKEAIHQVINQVAEASNIKLGKIAQPLRVAVTGDTISPSIDITLTLLGKEKVLQRITHAMNLSQ
jgi:glutamyl-tRNA synthetase